MARHQFTNKARALERMRRIPPAVRAAVRAELHRQAGLLVDNIKPNVPVQEGELRESVEWHPNPRGDRISVVVTEGRRQENDPLNRKARAVEFGRPETSESGPMEAQPHFFPTYRAFKRRIQRALQREARKAARAVWSGNLAGAIGDVARVFRGGG